MRRHSIRNGWRPLTGGGSPSESPRSESPGHRALTSIGRHVRSPTMNWHHREPTLDEILSDSIVRAVMEVDGVNPHELETMLRRMRECGVSGRKQLQRLLSPALFVFAGEFPESFPRGRLDDLHRDRAQCDCCFGRADCAPVFETRRRALFRHRLAAFNQSADWFVPIDEVTDGGDIDALFGAGANDRNIDAFHQYGGGSVSNLDDGQPTADARIDS